MFKSIVKKEILENIAGYRFPLFALICVILLPLGMYVNGIAHAQRVRDFGQQTRLADEAVRTIQLQDIMAGTVAIKGFRPPAALSVFATGLESALPRYYEFTQDGPRAGESSSGEESIISVQGKVDFVFIVQMVLSLIGFLFASDLICGEKEAGTLRAMLANRIPRDTILVGKIGGGALSLGAPFAAAFLLGILVLWIGAFPIFGGGTPARLLVIFLAASVFILIYHGIGVAVSTSTNKTRTSLVAILLIWVSFQLIIPKLADMIAAIAHPVRTETEVSLEKTLLARSLDLEAAKELGLQYDRIFSGAPEGAVDDENSPVRKRWFAEKDEIQRRARERKASEIGRIEEAYQQQKRRQQALALNLSLVSPSAAFAYLVADVCGTGEVERTKYTEAVRAYQNALDGALFSKVGRTVMIHPGGATSLGFSAQPVDTKALPIFSIKPASLGEAIRANWKSMASLIFWLIAPFIVAYVRFLRYDVR
jgi:ABC-type transport system involved in multi-copper enzyme maturation permease subunit